MGFYQFFLKKNNLKLISLIFQLITSIFFTDLVEIGVLGQSFSKFYRKRKEILVYISCFTLKKFKNYQIYIRYLIIIQQKIGVYFSFY